MLCVVELHRPTGSIKHQEPFAIWYGLDICFGLEKTKIMQRLCIDLEVCAGLQGHMTKANEQQASEVSRYILQSLLHRSIAVM